MKSLVIRLSSGSTSSEEITIKGAAFGGKMATRSTSGIVYQLTDSSYFENAIFDDITASENLNEVPEYRCIYLYNNGSIDGARSIVGTKLYLTGSTYAEFIRVEDIIKNVDKTTGGIVDKSAGLVLDEVEENSFKQIALTWDELPVTTVEDQTGARAARNSKSGMVKLVLNFCVAQELLVESQDRYYPTDRFRSLIENYFDDYRGRFAELMNGGRDATD